MKNLNKLVLGFTALILLLCGCKETVDIPSSTASVEKVSGSYQEVAMSYVKEIMEEDYQAISNNYNYDEEMMKLVNDNQLNIVFESLITQNGKIIEVQNSNEIAQGAYVIVQVPTLLEKDNITINVVFDVDRNIAGVNFSEYIEPLNEVVSPIHLPTGATEVETPMIMRDGKELSGTLTLPNLEKLGPIVVLVHGSGPNDRDETIYGNTIFRDIAYLLAEKGIASYRYDKRTYLYSEESAEDTTFTVYDETINDVVDIVSILKSSDEVNKDEIYVLGHSLGGYCIPRIAQETEVAGYIMMAAPVSDLKTIMEEQFQYLSNFSDDKTYFDEALEELKRLENIEILKETDVIMGMGAAYWKDILSYEPLIEANTIDEPILVLQGEEDYQVTMSEYMLWKDEFEEKSNWSFISYEGLSHLMMPGDISENPNQYYTIKNNVDKRVSDDIAEFLLK